LYSLERYLFLAVRANFCFHQYSLNVNESSRFPFIINYKTNIDLNEILYKIARQKKAYMTNKTSINQHPTVYINE
jgi:hypothetical protein